MTVALIKFGIKEVVKDGIGWAIEIADECRCIGCGSKSAGELIPWTILMFLMDS
jgi:hypothetical protein